MISTRSLISKSSTPSTNHLVTVTRAPVTTGITVTFMFPIFFFSSLASLGNYHTFRFLVSRIGKIHYLASSFLFFNFIYLFIYFFFFFFFFLTITRCGRLTEIKWSVYILKSKRTLCVSFSSMDSGLCIYHLFIWSNLNFLHNSQWITLPTNSFLVWYSLCAILLHLLCD